MAESNEERQFNEALIARTKAWREEKGWTAEQMAVALGIPADRYRKYETRTCPTL
jgi:transcriptional regulator with XRE-family HTH domain